MASATADLTPQDCGANTGQQQGANLVLDQGLLQIHRCSGDLDPRANRTDVLAVDAGQIGEDLLIQQIEVVQLAFYLTDALAQHIEHVTTS